VTNNFPELNFELSPYTGWTRAHWEAILARMTYGYWLAAERSGSAARVLYPDDRRGLPDGADAIESFARMASGWAGWLSNPNNPAEVTFDEHMVNIEMLVRNGLLDGTNKANPRTYWGDMDHLDQRIVESADIAVVIWMSRERVFNKMTEAEKSQVIGWLAQVDGLGTYPDNWILFSAVAQAVRLHLGYPVPEDELDERLEHLADFYRGDGWYVDGPGDEFELYNAWMFSWHFPLWAMIDGDRKPQHKEAVLKHTRSFMATFTHFFGSNGSYPAWGRSIVYRFAALAGFGTTHLMGIAPGTPGLLRRATSGCIKYFYDNGFFDPDEHYVRQGYHGDFPPAGEAYISPGSPYWCCHGLFGLAFSADDPFWTEVEQPLPVDQGDFELTLPAPGLSLIGRKATGQVLLLNSRGGQAHDAPRHNYTSKYGKYVYSTHFPFNVVPVRGSYSPDAHVSLTYDGKHFGHRLFTRLGEAGPGFMWCKYEQVILDEPQPMWVAVVVEGDIQIRLTHIRPAFPVRAYEAPGALGTDSPTKIVRRSDAEAGWEYAEVDGKGIGIRRLMGYQSQAESLPFLDQTNINVAYLHAEQPMVLETELRMAPRSLAAVSLVRPEPFDPAKELGSVEVVKVGFAGFRVTLPSGAKAFVALGDNTPRKVMVDGVAIEGDGLRLVKLSADHKQVSGLGVTKIEGVASFASRANVSLKRDGETATVITNVGTTLDAGWLGGNAKQVEVLGWQGQWHDVTSECDGNTVPVRLVQKWADETDRVLVTLRVKA
jgi:hypothetical protein